MPATRSLALLVACLVVPAGCLAPAPSHPAPRTGSTPLQPAAESSAPNATTTVPRLVPVSLDLVIPAGGAACLTPDLPCARPGGGYLRHDLPNGTRGVKLDISRTPTSPATQRLAILVYLLTTQPDGSQTLDALGYTRGTSPLHLEDAVPAWDPANATLYLFAAAPNLAPPPAGVALSTGQPFHAEGTLTEDAMSR